MREIISIVRRKKVYRRGFTLVEILVVISIIAVLIALIMPGVQSARESARRTLCGNNLHQMALGCTQLEAKYGFFPGGGWGWKWAGESDRGFGTPQPGGWHFQILPFIDQNDLHDYDHGLTKLGDSPSSNLTRMQKSGYIAQQPVAVFLCPTRNGRLQAFPYTHAPGYVNIPDPFPTPPTPPVIGRSDYASNGGSDFIYNLNGNTPVPGAGDEGATVNGVYYPPYSTNFPWSTVLETINSTASPCTGVIGVASQVTSAMVKDGTSYTYLIGERYLNPSCYTTGTCCDNDQGWDEGFDWDTVRCTGVNYVYVNPTTQVPNGGMAPRPGTGTPTPPSQDRKNYSNDPSGNGCSSNFGSAHEAGFNMAFCDGTVKLMSYSIDPVIHMELGHRADGQPTQLNAIGGAGNN